MRSKIRLLWMQWHTYTACFFLPISLLYAATGVLYLFDIKGGVKHTAEYTINLANTWPQTEQQAERIAAQHISQYAHPSLPPDYYPYDGNHSWYGFKQEVILSPMEVDNQAQLTVKEHDLWHQLLLIHKGHAGQVFWLIGIAMGISLTFSLISGVVLSLNMRRFRKPSIYTIGLGVVVVVVAFING